MADETSGLSRSVEDYLKVIYSLCLEGETVSTSAIAEALVVQPASVTGMVKRLAESSYVEHVPYRGVRLTEIGTKEALRVLRRHRILETYLTQRLDYPWEDVHPEAERLEHAASDQLIERMAAALGNPRHDPHGAPIPTPSGDIEDTDSRTLAELATGEEAIVRAVRDDDSEGLLAVEAAGLLPGARVRVTGRTTTPPGLHLEVDESNTETRHVILSLAERVYVVSVPSNPDAGNNQ
jgi:DtxR family Mn-dependent transcriptional regulator